jgi:hypothetical protein
LVFVDVGVGERDDRPAGRFVIRVADDLAIIKAS